MEKLEYSDPVALVIFGAGGDLTRRKLVPALYDLYLDGGLPDKFALIGTDAREMSPKDFIKQLRDGTDEFSRFGKTETKRWQAFAQCIRDYLVADLTDRKLYQTVGQKLDELNQQWQGEAVRLFYQATPPSVVEGLIEQLGAAGLAQNRQKSRIVLEKPFGWDANSAAELNRKLASVFDESQIFRIDHFLGKETVQNILALRFANGIFEPIWDRRYVDHVQINMPEKLGVEHRGPYYEKTGALRDMIENHLMQVMCLIAMDAPVAFEADTIRDKKVEVLRAVRPIEVAQVHDFTARGQYGPGWIEGEQVPGYRQEPGVDPQSDIETYAAVKLFIDNWRWQDVPFYLRTGKRMAQTVSEVSINFRPAPHQAFPPSAIGSYQMNRLVLYIDPEEGIRLRFYAKRPGQGMKLSPVDMQFSYKQAFHREPAEAYETLLADAMVGDATLFKRRDQVEASWAVVMPIIEGWSEVTEDFPNYAAGTWGPETGEALIARDGRAWQMPTPLNDPDVCEPPEARPGGENA
ncbi:MAG: glucose-6-phosphate dehydrogenase [Bacteroidota bacterium]